MGRFTFEQHTAVTGGIAQRISSLAAAGNFRAAGSELARLRRTCVSCHVLFGGDSYGSYPSEGSILTGEVDVLKLNGERRRNRSNVLVFIDRVPANSDETVYPGRPTFSQRNRAFEPRVLPVVKGMTVEFPNDDTIFHNVFSLSRTKMFDLDIYPPGESRTVEFASTGWVKVYCNIHPNMIAHILVLDNSFFTLTDKWGRFVISGLPDGVFSVRVWHEFAPDAARQVTLRGAELQTQSFVIQENRQFIQHPNKFGKPYRRRYE